MQMDKYIQKSGMLIIIFVLLLFTTSNLYANEKEQIKIGILAKRGTAQTLQRWEPLAEYLNQQIPTYTFQIVPLGFDALDEAVSNASIDFVLTNTVQYVTFEYRYGVSRIATLQNHSNMTSGQERFGGVIFTKKATTDIHTLKDLRKKRFAAVDPASFGGWIMAKKELLEHKVKEKDFSKLLFLHSHDAVVNAVLDGRADAGTVRSDTLERMAVEGKIQMDSLRILSEKNSSGFPFVLSTRLYPEWPFAKLRHTSEALGESVLIALLGIEPKLDVAKRTKVDHWTIPLDYSPVHDLLKELNMPPYDIEITFSAVMKKYATEIILVGLIILVLSVTMVFILLLYRRLKKQSLHIAALNEELTQNMERERIFRKMLDSQTALTMLGDEKRIIECNQAFLNFFGVTSSKDIVSQGGLCKHIVKNYDEDEPHRCFADILAMQHQGEDSKITMYNQDGERRVFHVHIDRFAHDSSLFVINLVDITSNEELHQRLMLLQKAVNQSNNTVLISTMDGIVQYVNNSFCECGGYTEAELIGHHTELMNTMGLNPLSSKELYSTLSENKMWVGEVKQRHKDGCDHIIHISISPVKDANDKITHLIAIGEDVSKYRQIENKLKEKEQMLLSQSRLAAVGEMLSMIAHQWRQPLSIIQMSLNDLELTLSLMNIEEQDNIAVMSKQVNFLSSTIDDFSNYFQKEVHVETFKFDMVISDVIRLLEKNLENNSIKIEQEGALNMQISTKRQDIVQVLINLINNAKEVLVDRATSSAKIIMRSSYLADDALFVIEVIDNGGGVDEAVKHRIFEPYFSTKKTKEGSGLGLYMAKSIVENSLHGSIGFEDIQDGTRFYIKIPSLKPEEENLYIVDE